MKAPVPSGWRETTVRRILRRLDRPAGSGLGVITAYRDGTVTLRSNRRAVGYTFSDTEDGYQEVRPGDLVFHALDGFAGAVGVADSNGNGSPVYHVCEPTDGGDARYLARLLRHLGTSGFLATQAPNVRERSIDFRNWNTFARVPLIVPPAAEQHAIADYLDRETAQIDALIAKQEQLIDVLRERRAAVQELALSGLDWSVPLRSVAALIQTGPFGSQLKADEYEPGGVPVINPAHVVAGRVTPDAKVAVGPQKAVDLARHAFRAGDIVVARRGELGRCAVVTVEEEGYLCGTGSALIRPLPDRIHSRFLALAYRTRRNRDALGLASVGSTMDNVNADILGALRMPVPPLDAQRTIVSDLVEQTAQIDALIAKTERFIELSKERRAALITAAVTGQIHVGASAGGGCASPT